MLGSYKLLAEWFN